MHYPRSKKGFTLVEIIVAILVMSLVFGMTTMLAVSISGYNKDKTHITTCHEEVARVQLFIKNWAKSLDDAFNTSYTVSQNGQQLSVQSGLYWFKDANNSFDLWFTEDDQTITGDFYINGELVTKTESYTKISSIHFKLGNEDDLLANTARCLITLNDGAVYTLVLQKESSKAGLPVIFSQPFEQKVGEYNEFIFITSGDWDSELNATEYKNLEDIDKLGSFSAAYQYAALSMLRVQVDHQSRMSLEAFTSAFGAKWQVRIFSASGKVAYGMKLLDSEFPAANHRLSFFIEEGSILFDGTPIEPMGYTRKPGAVGTLDWHDAAELTFKRSTIEGGLLYFDFDTNIFWDELDTTSYEQVQYDNIRRLYGLSDAFGAGIENGLYIALDAKSKHLGAFGDDDVYVTFDNQGANGTVRVRVGLNAGNLGSFDDREVIFTFTTLFMLPDGTPLREENTFRCSDIYTTPTKNAVSVSPAGEYFTGSTGSASGDPLAAYDQFHIEYYIHAPWTDSSRSSYMNLENKPGAYGLSEDFYTRLFDNIYIGLDGNEITLRNAITKYKFSISLHKDSGDRTILRLTVNTSDMTANGYPMDLTKQVLSIRFGYGMKSGSDILLKPFCLPGDVPVRFISLARPAADFSASHWLTRHSLSSKVNSSQSGNTLYVDFTSNGLYRLPGPTFYQVLSQGQGFPTAYLNSIKNKLELTIDGTTKTLAAWGAENFDVVVFERDSRWAMQLQIKNGLVTGKDLTIHFREGFVGPDGTTLLMPIKFVRDGTNSWTGSASSDVYLPNRTVAIHSTSNTTHSMAVTLPSGSFSGTAPFKVYAKVKMENAAVIGNGSASIILDYASSNDLTIATLTADTDGWISLNELHGKNFDMKKENASIVFKMTNMTGKLTIADLVVADSTGKILYSMANDTTLYGVGDIKNVDDTYCKWSAVYDSGVTYPIITRGDARYVPNRILKVVVNSGYTGGDASLLIGENQFADGVTYYVTGRIRTNVTGKTSAANVSSNSSNVSVSGAGDTKHYGVPNGEWVALTNADGTPLTFIGGVIETPKTITSAHRSIGIHAKHDMTNGKMTIQTDAATAKFGANRKLIVRGYYKVTDFTSLASGGCVYIGDGASAGRVTVKNNQTNWTYFKLEWNTNTNLDFEFMGAMGYLYIANLTIEDTNRNVVYDMATDAELKEGYHTGFPWAPSIWYITYFGEPDAMDFSVDAVGSATPKQYSTTRTETATQTLSSVHRSISIHAKNDLQNGKIVITAAQAIAKFGANKTMYVRGYYQVSDYKAVGDNPWWQIGSNASSGASGKLTGNQTTWKYFKLTWNTSTDLNFEFWNANGYLRLANVTIEDSNYNVVYDMSTDTALDGTYYTSFPQSKGIWYITYTGAPNAMDLSIDAVGSSTPKQYTTTRVETPTATISSGHRYLAIGAANNMINAKMVITSAQAAAKFGANQTLTVRGYYKVVNYKSLGTGNKVTIGGNASSGTVSVSTSVTTYTYFKLTWNTSKDLNFEFWMSNGLLYLSNLTIENSSGTILYDLSTDTNLYATGAYYTDFPRNPSIWYFGYSTNASYPNVQMDLSVEAATTATPKQYTVSYPETPTDTIADSAVKRKIGIHAAHNLQNGKMVITSAQATAKFGANQNLIVRGYYKVTGYTAIGDSPWWQIGSNASSGASGKLTGNQTTWKYFKLTWNTSNDLNFEFWNCNGFMYLANLTIENASGTVTYDMSTDTALNGTYYTSFPQQKGIWYITDGGGVNFMDASVSAVKTSATPKQYSVTITEHPTDTIADSAVKRKMGIHAAHSLQNGKMVITSAQATAKFGANQDLIVRGYYKVTGYEAIGDNPWWQIGSNAASGAIKSTGNQTTWKYFKLTWNTSKDLNFEFWNCNGFMYLANLTIENASGTVTYDLSTDSNLYPNGGYYNDFPRDPSIWYISDGGGVNFMDMSNTAVKTSSTPKQYDEDWDYLKFTMWYATGSMEIADLTIYHYNGSTKVIDYSMATDANFASDYSRVNTNSALFTVWRSNEWITTGAINFPIYIDYNSNTTHYDSEYQVPKFTDVVG